MLLAGSCLIFFSLAYSLTLKMDIRSFSETSVNIYQTAWHNITENTILLTTNVVL
jgi:hypothetical protein